MGRVDASIWVAGWFSASLTFSKRPTRRHRSKPRWVSSAAPSRQRPQHFRHRHLKNRGRLPLALLPLAEIKFSPSDNGLVHLETWFWLSNDALAGVPVTVTADDGHRANDHRCCTASGI